MIEYVLHSYVLTHPQVSVGNVCVVHCVRRVLSIVVCVSYRSLSAVNLDETPVVDVTRVLQLVEDVTCLILYKESCAGWTQRTHRQFLREHVHDEGVKRLHAGQLMSDVHPPRLVTELQEQHR